MATKKAPDGAQEFEFPDEKENKTGEEQENEEKDTLDVSVSEEGETDVTVDVVDDTPEQDRGHKPGASKDVTEVSDEELETYSGNVKKRINELSFARHDERRQKEAALREKQELERFLRSQSEELKRLRGYVQTGEQAYMGTAKAAAEAKLDVAKRKYKEAHEQFDTDAIIAAQQEMMAAQMELAAAQNFRPSLQPDTEGVYQQPTEQVQPDERAIRWQQQNPWFGANRKMTAYALAAHEDLVSSGLSPQSDEYYKRIDAEIRKTFPEQFGEQKKESTTTQQPASSHRKPASVVAPTPRSRSANKITLTQTQANLAKKLGISLEDYAKQVQLLENSDGR